MASPASPEKHDNKPVKLVNNAGYGAADKPKPKLKSIETEHLRTDHKLANLPSPVNFK